MRLIRSWLPEHESKISAGGLPWSFPAAPQSWPCRERRSCSGRDMPPARCPVGIEIVRSSLILQNVLEQKIGYCSEHDGEDRHDGQWKSQSAVIRAIQNYTRCLHCI